jgi:MFS transporter, ACS family, hexuronate transporter
MALPERSGQPRTKVGTGWPVIGIVRDFKSDGGAFSSTGRRIGEASGALRIISAYMDVKRWFRGGPRFGWWWRTVTYMAKSYGRWIVLGVFVFSTSINILDRQILSALAPTIKTELHMTGAQYGALLSIFSFTYAISAPVAGWLVDHVGVSSGLSLAIGLWSLASIASGFSRSLASLARCRAFLGAGESAGMPALAKVNALYLPASEFGLSLAVNNIAIALGSSSAPLLVATVAPAFGWRSVFFITGAAGFLWIPFWLVVCRHTRCRGSSLEARLHFGDFARDSRLWGLAISNALVMTAYTVWTNWTTLYFVQQLRLNESDANRHYAWIPPIFAMFGGFFGGWLSYYWIRRGMRPDLARLRGCWLAAIFMFVAAVLPFVASAIWATVAISTTMFWAMSLQMNVHILPVDIFGPERAGMSVSVLAFSYGLMQMLVSPVIGAVVDRYGFSIVCMSVAFLPLGGVWVLKASLRSAAIAPIKMRQHA